MIRISILLFGLFFSILGYGQNSVFEEIPSMKDSILLNNFWNNFSNAINTNDKLKLAALCKFPFYCSPCMNDSNVNPKDPMPVKITRKLFISGYYRVLFEERVKFAVNEIMKFDSYTFHPSIDPDKNLTGYYFLYTISKPSKSWEGSQGLIFIQKVNGLYKITDVSTVP